MKRPFNPNPYVGDSLLDSAVCAGLLLAVVTFQTSPVFAQGSLTPPGAPAPTMKTLEQIEPRIPITNVPYTITAPGSYYLTTNRSVGGLGGVAIDILASGVTVDLMGFELSGTIGNGIRVTGAQRNIVIRNGTLRGWITQVFADSASNSQFDRLRLIGPSTGHGISAGSNSVVTACSVEAIGADWKDTGIRVGAGSVIRDCMVVGTAGYGIEAGTNTIVSRCSSTRNSRSGMVAGDGSVISQCVLASNYTWGVELGRGCVISDSVARGNGATGISADSHCRIKDCVADDNGGDGISAKAACQITGCTITSNDGNGIDGVLYSLIQGCLVSGSAFKGITATSQSQIIGNELHANGTGGIHITAGYNRIERNNVEGGPYGIHAESGGNLIIRNSVRTSSGTNYFLAANNKVGPIVQPPNSGAIAGSTGGAGVGTTDPWANFSY